MKFLIINGPNLNLLGLREPEIYGRKTYASLVSYVEDAARKLGVELTFFQSNHEGSLVDKIQEAYGRFDGIVINPAAYTHSSIAILDALKAVNIPTVEVHLSDIHSREAFRDVSITSGAALKVIYGKGFDGYREALSYLKAKLNPKDQMS